MSRLLVLCWHNVEPTDAFPGPSAAAGRAGFERQLRWVQRWLTVVPLRAALDDLAAGRRLPRRAVALTFDDGYLDNLTVAAPMLSAAGIPATFFLVPRFLSGSASAWWEDLAWTFAHATRDEFHWNGERHLLTTPANRRALATSVAEQLKTVSSGQRRAAIEELRGRLEPDGPVPPRRFMDWDGARQLARHGHDVQSHTCSHPILSRDHASEQAVELAGSRQELQQGLGASIDVLAYPNGSDRDFDDETVRLARDAGYGYALTTQAAWAGPATDPFRIPRLVLDPAVDDLRLLKRSVAALISGRAPRAGHR